MAMAAAVAKRCMNPACAAPPTGPGPDWRKGWPLRSGGFALLCDKCGFNFCRVVSGVHRLAYEQLVFCDIFHQKESGWRDCSFCGKVRSSNSTIVPLFEKVLSASDAGRIGRLVLPKACAEDSQISAIANGSLLSETLFSTANENLGVVSGYPGFLQSIKGAADFHPSSLYDHHMNSADGDVSWLKADKFGSRPDEGSLQFLQKRSRNIGSKSRRFLMDTEDAMELKLTWEEAQELLRPAPSAKPTIVMIEDYEFEEYDARTPCLCKEINFHHACYRVSKSLDKRYRIINFVYFEWEQDQWIQCDDCSKWRRLPLTVIVASKWTCTDNSWDPKSCSCSAPEELTPKELQCVLQQYEEMRRRKGSYGLKLNVTEMDASSLDALASAAVFGDVGNQATASVATTTKHPRHRPGCTCIVCIQPPSGKGPKHNPACTCNVCMTVRRRFKTLMMRKKQRQSEREEAEASKKIAWMNRDEPEGSNLSRSPQTLDTTRDSSDVTMFDKAADANKGHIDLNFHPAARDDHQGQHGAQQPRPAVSMMGLMEVASRPLDNYMKQNGLTSLAGEQAAGSSITATTVLPAPVESEERTSNEGRVASVEREPDTMAVDEAGENQQEKAADESAPAAATAT
nr:unnamed protein product [Digitaria exilis]